MEKGKFQSLPIAQVANLMLQFDDLVRLRHGGHAPHLTQEKICIYCLLCQGKSFAECGIKLFDEDLFINQLGTVDCLDIHEMFDRNGYEAILTHEHVNSAGKFRGTTMMVVEQQNIIKDVMNECEDMSIDELREMVLEMPPCKEASKNPPAIIKKESIKKHFMDQKRKELAARG